MDLRTAMIGFVCLMFGALGYQGQRWVSENKLYRPPPEMKVSIEQEYFITVAEGKKLIFHLQDVVTDPLCMHCHSKRLDINPRKDSILLECPTGKEKVVTPEDSLK